MTVRLDPLVRVGDTILAVLSRVSVTGASGQAIWVHGTKRPVAILAYRDGATMAFDSDGTRIAPDDFERRFPGRLAEFQHLADCPAPDPLDDLG